VVLFKVLRPSPNVTFISLFFARAFCRRALGRFVAIRPIFTYLYLPPTIRSTMQNDAAKAGTSTPAASSPQPSNNSVVFHVAVVGGGIAGSCVASVLSQKAAPEIEPWTKKVRRRAGGSGDIAVRVDLFDQGRSGVGGRSSHRVRKGDEGRSMRWDHGCQFFRADTDKVQAVVSDWIRHGIVEEWTGNFTSDGGASSSNDFFGFPFMPPFYVGSDGMQNISRRILEICSEVNNDCQFEEEQRCKSSENNLNVYTGTRVSNVKQDSYTKKWHLYGTSGEAAYHDTPERIARSQGGELKLGRNSILDQGYDAVVFTDVSSSFGKWHRASAGIPEEFAARVRERVGSRVPLFTAMIAFDEALAVSFDAISFQEDDVLWFASKSNSKPGISMNDDSKECWTLVSTPEYAMKKILETPMQDPNGEFIPQSEEYLTTVPGPELEAAFRNVVRNNTCGGLRLSTVPGEFSIPKTVYLDAQRWGSALPSGVRSKEESKTRKVISGVSYDSGRTPLAPTKLQSPEEDNFVFDKNLMLFQVGDMMSRYTPGFEGSVISAIDGAEHLLDTFSEF